MRKTLLTATTVALFAASVPLANAVEGTYDSPIPLNTLVSRTATVPLNVPWQVCEVDSWFADVINNNDGTATVTLDPQYIDPGRERVSVHILGCEGQSVSRYLSVYTPFVIDGDLMAAPWSTDRNDARFQARIGTADDVTVTAHVLADGEVVKTFAGNETAEYRVTRKDSAKKYVLRVEGSDGSVVEEPIAVATKWAPMSRGFSPYIAPCSTLTYFYDKSGQPKKAGGFLKDVKSSFDQLAAASGLSFQPVASVDEADIVVNWDANIGVAGFGGYSYDNGTWTGEATFNSTSRWVSQKGFKKDKRGIPGRGALILHELGHVLGLGHVDTHDSIMESGTSNKSAGKLTKHDKEGLRYLYKPDTCGP